ncbi:MAG: nucleoside triphosphate pyrophosphatase [bacterium]|nr:nucleoside triphosphate pyrophosphatase [bacterium]
MKTLVLASSSPRRKEILERARIPFIVDVGEYEEDLSLSLSPHELVKHLALGKARAVQGRHPNSIIIGADLVVVFNDGIMGKPHTVERAKEMLISLSGKMNVVVTGYAVLDTTSGKVITKSVDANVYFREMSEREIDGYIATGEPLDKAGAYGIQDMGGVFIEKCEGDFSGIVGIPLCSLMQTLKQFGVEPFDQSGAHI